MMPSSLKKSFPKTVSPETAKTLGKEMLDAIALHSRGEKKTTVKEISKFLDRGADINIADLHGNTPLIWVAFEGSEMKDFIKLFLERGADVNTENMYGNGAFVSTVSFQDKDIINMFLARDDLDISLTDDKGLTASQILVKWYDNHMLANLIDSYPMIKKRREAFQKEIKNIEEGLAAPMKRPKKLTFKRPSK